MGFEDRDYMRGSGPRGGFFEGAGGGLPPVIKWLLIVNVAVFLLQIVWTRPMGPHDLRSLYDLPAEQIEQHLPELSWLPRVSVVQDWLELSPQDVVYRGQVWRLLTYAFCHSRASVWHILMNMWVLWMFGQTLERMYGSREFLWFYLTAAVVAGVAFVALAFLFDSLGPAIGASGAVMAVLMLFAIHYPRHTIYLFFIIPVEVRWIVLLYVIFDLHPILLQIGGDQAAGNVAHSAHLGGLAFGYLYWKYGLRLDDIVSRLRLARPRWRLRARRNIRLYEPPRREDLSERVDAILQKIHDHGEASLTDDERTLLREASRRYKSR